MHYGLCENGEYSYFERGCRKNCSRQSRKVLCVVLYSLFFKEILKNAREAMDICLRLLKESNKRSFDSFSVINSVLIISHSYLLGLSCAYFFPKTFLEIAVRNKVQATITC